MYHKMMLCNFQCQKKKKKLISLEVPTYRKLIINTWIDSVLHVSLAKCHPPRKITFNIIFFTMQNEMLESLH